MSFSRPGSQHRIFPMPFGTTLLPAGGVLFRLWAPSARHIDLRLTADDTSVSEVPMDQLEHGWFSAFHPDARPGNRYQFLVDRNLLVPDPASRCQAEDVHGPSVVCDPAAFCWQDAKWSGRPWEETVVYELHVGSFSPQGTFRGVIDRLDYLSDLGVTAIELMPLAQFPGRFNWGYDGTLLFAPYNGYGTPEELKELVQAAHLKGLMVFLDVVYNHLGPEGNYLFVYAGDAFFTDKFHTPWGAAINFSGPQSRTVRDFYIANACYWLEEYNFDGLRFDAVHAITDKSKPDILEELARQVCDAAGASRKIHLILENDHNASRYLRRNREGNALFYRAQWNDDIHHACHVLLTGETAGYYADYADNPVKYLGRCLTEGFAYQGEKSIYREGKARGEPSAYLPPTAFVSFLQNHDQVGNRALGERLISLCAENDLLIVTALILLAPSPPMLFMGEEFGADSPFYFFSDFGPELAAGVTEGRRKEFARFPQFNEDETREQVPDPCAEKTFLQSRVQWRQIERLHNKNILHHYRELLQCRRREIIPRLDKIKGGRAECILHGARCLEARWAAGGNHELRVICNIDREPFRTSAIITGEIFYRFPAGMNIAASQSMMPAKSIIWLLQKREKNHG